MSGKNEFEYGVVLLYNYQDNLWRQYNQSLEMRILEEC